MTLLQIASLCTMLLGAGLLAWLARKQELPLQWRRWQTWRQRLHAARRQGHAATASALQTLRCAVPAHTEPQPSAERDPVWPASSLPRLLFMGDAAATLPALLAAVEPDGPLPINQPLDEEPFWRWWKLPRLVAIELCPPPLSTEAPLDMLWLHALRALTRTQPDRPLDGIVLCVSPALLRSAPEVTLPLMQLLARRTHETPAVLHQHLPVHLLLTGLQELPGYDTLHATLSEPVRAQALGWRPPPSHETGDGEDAAFTLQAALHDMRLALLTQERSARERHDIHRFVEAVLALLPSLLRLHQTLDLSSDPRVVLQGVYLSAAGPQPAFIHDLFDRFLPVSAALARNEP